ncbi:MAG: helix-turn-helix domain-containing protein [Boseongicola sp.]|nr:MAG: helix-turn-helix domain-containing protein [Boseongicola sp.]
MTRPFTVDLGWAALLNNLGIRAADLLRSARLPDGLFTEGRPTLNTDEFMRLWNAVVNALDSETPALVLGQSVTSETFSPPLLAAFCSPNMTTASRRLATYKPLIGACILESHETLGGLELTYGGEPGVELPEEFLLTELVFLVHLIRLATKAQVNPIAVEMVSPPDHPAYAEFFGHRVRTGPFNRVVFAPGDADRPFLSANPALFGVFEPELRARLDELERDTQVTDRVRAVLMEAMPSGQPEVKEVARRLGMSQRSLQRKLNGEGTNFQAELQALRERLARGYLADTTHTSSEISFLLGYEDPNSFIRAFSGWTGTSPEAMRSQLH